MSNTDTYPDGAPRTHYDGSQIIGCPVCGAVYFWHFDPHEPGPCNSCTRCWNAGHSYRPMCAAEMHYRADRTAERGYEWAAAREHIIAGMLEEVAGVTL